MTAHAEPAEQQGAGLAEQQRGEPVADRNVVPGESPLLSVRDLHVSYGGIRALRGISFQVYGGQIVTLIGANGAGKSTTLRAISGIIPLSGGTVSFLGSDLARYSPDRIAGLGIAHVPEGRGIFANLTVYENLRLATYLRRDREGIAQDLDRVFTIFPRLKERQRQMGWTLSGGEQQMLAVARGLMTRCQLMLLDEPSMGLSPILVEQVFRVIQDIRKTGTTILLVEQNAHMALQIADYCYVMETGTLTISGTSDELMGDPKVREAYLGMAKEG
jgi:branched-chain amino acid transport system ATP-binding protein